MVDIVRTSAISRQSIDYHIFIIEYSECLLTSYHIISNEIRMLNLMI